ncbi:cold-shock protein [Halanaerobaculum tunisiense]
MHYGRVTNFDPNQGQGEIALDDQQQVIVDATEVLPQEGEAYSSISPNYNQLPQGAEVAFELEEEQEGLKAKNVVKL